MDVDRWVVVCVIERVCDVFSRGADDILAVRAERVVLFTTKDYKISHSSPIGSSFLKSSFFAMSAASVATI